MTAARFRLGDERAAPYTSPVMTRPAIEFCIKIFMIALVFTFVITCYKVVAMLGLI